MSNSPGLKAKHRCHKAKDFIKAKDWGSKAKDSMSHIDLWPSHIDVGQYVKVKDDNDHRFYVLHTSQLNKPRPYHGGKNRGPTEQT